MLQRPTRAERRCKRKLASGTSFPMYPPVPRERKKVQERIQAGEIRIGEEVVPSSNMRYSVDPDTHHIYAHEEEVSARKISLAQIRKQLLQKHEDLGIIRDLTDEQLEALSPTAVATSLDQLVIPYNQGESSQAMRQKLKEARPSHTTPESLA